MQNIRIFQNPTRHDIAFMSMAFETANILSKDPVVKVGAVITLNNEFISNGYNGFVRGADDSPEFYEDKDFKGLHMIHAEMNATHNALRSGRSTVGGTIYVTRLPCLHCTNHLIQAGIERIVAILDPVPGSGRGSKWHFEDAARVFSRFGRVFDVMPKSEYLLSYINYRGTDTINF